MAASVDVRCFGHLPVGTPVEAWTLMGSGGLVAEILAYGATITRLLVPDRDGHLSDVVLGFNDLDSYRANPVYMGAIAGRVAGRVAGARFSLDGREYRLAQNEGANHLHGGTEGFDKKLWTGTLTDREDGAPSLRLTYRGPDGEEGYPGTVDVSVTYTVTAGNALLVETEAAADKPTPVNLTQHSYFNLAGEGAGSVLDHELQIHSGCFAVIDEQMALVGGEKPVDGLSNDFRQPRNLRVALPGLFQKHGDLYRIRRDSNHIDAAKPIPAARLLHPASGRVLEVSTTSTHLQFYGGTLLDGSLIGKSGVPYASNAGLCLECEGYPDAVNNPEMGDIVVRPGSPRRETTAYAFLTAR
ncbi:MAG: aldose epimerase family protein [Terracidiphilus sp.]